MKKNKIKILFHTNPNITSFNAQDLNGREIASRLNKDLFDIYFIDILGTEIDPKLKKENIFILNAKIFNKNLSKIKKIYLQLKNKFDISFYIQVLITDSIFVTLNKLINKDRKTFFIVENIINKEKYRKFNYIFKYIINNVNYVFSISNRIKKEVKEYFNYETNIIPVGVDTKIFKPLSKKKENEKLKIISCGSLQERKQPLVFLEIAKLFPEYEFIWIGEGPLKNKILENSKNIKNFTLLSNKPQKELAKYFAESDIFLFPSIHEGFPKVVIESMACGLPSIVFNNYGPEAVLNENTGFIVKTKEEMIDKLKILANNKELRNKFSKNAIKRAKEFDWDIIVKKWEEFFINEINH